MKNLFKNEIYRLLKDKFIKVMFILAAVIPLAEVLAVKMVTSIIPDLESILTFTDLSVFVSCFCTSSLIGTIYIIGSISLTNKEFTFGTIRNKIVAGYDRTKIFLAKEIITILFGIIFLLISYIVSLLLYSLVFSVQFILVNNLLLLWIETIIIGLILIAMNFSLIYALAIMYKKSIKTLLIYFVIISVYSIVVEEVLFIIGQSVDVAPVYQWLPNFIETSYLNQDISGDILLKACVVLIPLTILFNFIGIKHFQKADLK